MIGLRPTDHRPVSYQVQRISIPAACPFPQFTQIRLISQALFRGHYQIYYYAGNYGEMHQIST